MKPEAVRWIVEEHLKNFRDVVMRGTIYIQPNSSSYLLWLCVADRYPLHAIPVWVNPELSSDEILDVLDEAIHDLRQFEWMKTMEEHSA